MTVQWLGIIPKAQWPKDSRDTPLTLITTPVSLDAAAGQADNQARGGVFGGLLLALAERQSFGLAVKNALTGRYCQVNASLATLFGVPAPAWLGHTDAELFDASLASALRAADQTALAHDGALPSDHRFEWRGQRRDFTALRSLCLDGPSQWLVSLWFDNAPQRAREQQLRSVLQQLEQEQTANITLRREVADQGLRDVASGLYTRPHFDDQIRREVDLSVREHREFAMVHIALDPFGPQVDAAGEAGQQRIFEAMGRLLRGNTRAMDASCRTDQRHFAVLLSGVGLATAHSRMEGLRRQCATQIVALDGRELGFTVSMGVASFPHTASNQAEVVVACDAALAEAQRRGGNTVALAGIRFDPKV